MPTSLPLRLDAAAHDEIVLLIAVAGGNREAFAALYRLYAPRLRAFLLGRTRGDATQTDEVVQETMLTVWKHAARYDPSRASVATWVFTIARNRFIDRVRRTARPEPDPDDPAFFPAAAEAPDALLDRSRRAARLHRALEQLPADQLAVLRESYFEGKAQSAVANALGVPLGTVKSRARLALDRLRSALEET